MGPERRMTIAAVPLPNLNLNPTLDPGGGAERPERGDGQLSRHAE